AWKHLSEESSPPLRAGQSETGRRSSVRVVLAPFGFSPVDRLFGCARGRFDAKSRFLGPEGARNDKGGDAAERLGAMRGEIFRLQDACGFEQFRRLSRAQLKLVQSSELAMVCIGPGE